jgi:branched-chain amino acid transport system ATP-binding protein
MALPEKAVNNADSKEILRLEALSRNFGGLRAVSNFGLTLQQGELKGLIGPNGAGKSTVFNLISGLYKPNSGRIFMDGEDITGKRPNVIANKGLARTFQTVKLLQGKSVLETMMTTFFLTYEYNTLDAILQTSRYTKQEKALEEKALHFLTKLGVDHLKDEISNELPYGFQRKVSIAGTLCLNPKVLLLDEPMAGLTHSEKNELINMIQKLKEEFDISIILVEHDMKVIMHLCDSIAVMNNGLLIAEGNGEEIRTNQNVIKAYLGKNIV